MAVFPKLMTMTDNKSHMHKAQWRPRKENIKITTYRSVIRKVQRTKQRQRHILPVENRVQITVNISSESKKNKTPSTYYLRTKLKDWPIQPQDLVHGSSNQDSMALVEKYWVPLIYLSKEPRNRPHKHI